MKPWGLNMFTFKFMELKHSELESFARESFEVWICLTWKYMNVWIFELKRLRLLNIHNLKTFKAECFRWEIFALWAFSVRIILTLRIVNLKAFSSLKVYKWEDLTWQSGYNMVYIFFLNHFYRKSFVNKFTKQLFRVCPIKKGKNLYCTDCSIRILGFDEGTLIKII